MTTTTHPPGPTDAAFGMTLANRFRETPLEFMMDMVKTYGDMVYMRFGPYHAFGLTNPELVKELLVTKNRHFRKMDRMKQVMSRLDGNGLILSEGDFWLRQRRLVQPVFEQQKLLNYGKIMVDQACKTADSWVCDKEFDIFQEMTALTLRIICRLFFSVDAENEAVRIGDAVSEISAIMVKDMSSPFLLPDWLPLPEKARFRECVHVLDDFITNIIKERKATGENKGDLLSMLLMAVDTESDGTGMTERQARDEAMTLFLAGHDSTAAALAWTWHLLARHQDVQTKVADEIATVFGTAQPGPDGARKLVFTAATIKEALRLYPPVWLIPRQAAEDTEIGGYKIPQGSFVYAWTYALHRSSSYWEKPEEFRPERFLPEHEHSVVPHSYIPFGEGPRGCIGNHFAMLESILIVAVLLQRYTLIPADSSAGITALPMVSLEPEGGVRVKIGKR